MPRQIRRVLGQHGERGAHLAAGTKDDQWTVQFRNERPQCLGRLSQSGV